MTLALLDTLGTPLLGDFLMLGMLVGANIAFGMYIFRWLRDYRDDAKSALDTSQ